MKLTDYKPFLAEIRAGDNKLVFDDVSIALAYFDDALRNDLMLCTKVRMDITNHGRTLSCSITDGDDLVIRPIIDELREKVLSLYEKPNQFPRIYFFTAGGKRK